MAATYSCVITVMTPALRHMHFYALRSSYKDLHCFLSSMISKWQSDVNAAMSSMAMQLLKLACLRVLQCGAAQLRSHEVGCIMQAACHVLVFHIAVQHEK